MKNFSCLIFDLDGTLVDSAQDIADSVNFMLTQMQLPAHSSQQVRRFIGDGMHQLILDAIGAENKNRLPEALEYFVPYYKENCTRKTVLYPGTLEVLEKFKNKKLAVLTNKPAAMTQRTLAALGIEGYFSSVISGDTLPTKKPDPQGLNQTLKVLSAQAKETLMIGDGNADILVAQKAEVLSCAAFYGYRPKEELLALKPNYTIEKITDLFNVVGGI